MWRPPPRRLAQPGSRAAVLLLVLGASAALAWSARLAWMHAAQLPLEAHSFRQTQTALTSYWIGRNGFSLAYETPVAGAPWSIPFEFPLYQWIVARIAGASGASLDATGRLVSYAFLLACLFPAHAICRRLRLEGPVMPVFALLLLSSPEYAYWGRTFMIETTALFLAMLALSSLVAAIGPGGRWRDWFLFATFILLCLLQKATTALPVLAVSAFAYLAAEARRSHSLRDFAWRRTATVGVAAFAVPLLAGVLWVGFTDRVKLHNPLGTQLTSANLGLWNWGTLPQRLSGDLWTGVYWHRMLADNLGGLLGALLLAGGALRARHPGTRECILACLALGVLPPLLFTNLHIVHDYYQSACLAFPIFGLAVVVGSVLFSQVSPLLSLLAAGLLAGSNYAALAAGYLPLVSRQFTTADRDVAVGQVLRLEMAPEAQSVILGNDWNSSIAYLSGHKSLSAPDWYRDIAVARTSPERLVDPGRFGALVSCSPRSLALDDLMRLAQARSWKVGETRGCAIALPARPLDRPPAPQADCIGGVDQAQVEEREGHAVVAISGWSVMRRSGRRAGQAVFLVIGTDAGTPRVVEALKTPRPDLNDGLGVAPDVDVGFSRLLAPDLPAGRYRLGLVHLDADGTRESCSLGKQLEIRN